MRQRATSVQGTLNNHEIRPALTTFPEDNKKSLAPRPFGGLGLLDVYSLTTVRFDGSYGIPRTQSSGEASRPPFVNFKKDFSRWRLMALFKFAGMLNGSSKNFSMNSAQKGS